MRPRTGLSCGAPIFLASRRLDRATVAVLDQTGDKVRALEISWDVYLTQREFADPAECEAVARRYRAQVARLEFDWRRIRDRRKAGERALVLAPRRCGARARQSRGSSSPRRGSRRTTASSRSSGDDPGGGSGEPPHVGRHQLELTSGALA